MGFKTVIVIPETQSQEKKDMIRLAGAELVQVPAVPYKNPNNYVKYSGRLAAQAGRDRSRTARSGPTSSTTSPTGRRMSKPPGPEIWEQTGGKVDGFICAVGSGGTLAGVGAGAAAQGRQDRRWPIPRARACTSIYTGEDKPDGNSITEGIGQGRITANLEGFTPDFAYHIPDAEALPIVFDLLQRRGAVPGRIDRHQRRRRDPPGARDGARATPS